MQSTHNRTIEQRALAKAIYKIRLTKDVKREHIADILALGVGSIDKIEQGKTHLRFTDAIRICDALEIALNELVEAYKRELNKLAPPAA